MAKQWVITTKRGGVIDGTNADTKSMSWFLASANKARRTENGQVLSIRQASILLEHQGYRCVKCKVVVLA